MLIKVINDDGQDIGSVEHSCLIKLGLRHQIVKLIIYCDVKNSVLVQQRSIQDPSCPGMWDNAVSGHVDANEDNLVALIRETKEEIGLKINPDALRLLGDYNTEEKLKDGILRRKTSVYLYIVKNTDIILSVNYKELEKIAWVELDDIYKVINNFKHAYKSSVFTKGSVKSFKLLFKHLDGN